MINQLSIKGFKSIRQFDLNCRKVNVFIGDPNAGKTNILEALGLWCSDVLKDMRSVMRSKQVADLFRDQDLGSAIEVNLDKKQLYLQWEKAGAPKITVHDGAGHRDIFNCINQNLSFIGGNIPKSITSYYLFNSESPEDAEGAERLSPPFGKNLVSLLYSRKEARQTSARFFNGTNFRLNVDFTAKRLLVTKEVDETFISFPYTASSETLRRMIFYHLALDTNRNAVLVFDEPEAHAFPPFTKLLAERIASDDQGNQFFLTTHSPYMLDSLLSKTPKADLNVVLCRMENFETKGYPLNERQISKLMGWSMDAFFNFDRLLDEKE